MTGTNTATRAKAPADYNPMDPALVEDPYQYYKDLRAEAPVFQCPHTKLYMVSRYDLIVEACRQPDVFSNQFGQLLRGRHATAPEVIEVAKSGYQIVDTMLTADPPRHTRYRALSMKAFTPKRVNEVEPFAVQTANALIDSFIDKGEVEFMSAFCQPLPLSVIANQLGVPATDMPLFRRWSDSFTAQLGGFAGLEGEVAAMKNIVEFQHYFAKKCEEKRANPTSDIISDLVHAQVEGERPLDMAELLSILQQLLVAGNETTASSLCEGMYYLISNPAQLAAVQADPSLVPNLVEEVLRMATPTQNMFRVTTRDTVLGGVKILQGAGVLLRFGSGNRDEAKYADAETFDIKRENARTHLAFGYGIHTCLGAALARKEMNVAFPILLKRLANLRFVPGKNDFKHTPSFVLRGMPKLWIAFDKA